MTTETDELLDILDNIRDTEILDWDGAQLPAFSQDDERFNILEKALMNREPKVLFQLYNPVADNGWGEWQNVNVNSKNYFKFENMVIYDLVAYEDGTYRIRLEKIEEVV